MRNLLLGILFGVLGQLGSFLQFQCSFKYGWLEKYPIQIALLSIPVSFAYIKSVHYMIEYFDGQLWPGRLIGFAIGIIMFAILGIVIFKEAINLKTAVMLGLSFLIVLTQIFWKTN